ncbi:MAG: hypothetical protein ABF449_02655 [Ethanoligenens sp.]
MSRKGLKILISSLFVCVLIPLGCISAFALSWDGSSTGGGGAGSPAGPNGYAIRTTGDNCLGYRFSVVDKAGNNKVSKVIDVFRNTSYGNMEYSSTYKFTPKLNKKQLITYQNSSFSTNQNTTNCYKETNMGFATALPAPDGMETWQNNINNLNPLLSSLGVGNINNLSYGDKVLVEPLYDIRLQSVYHSLTVTEIAIYGKWILGANSDGGSSSTSASWGFISSYTNKYYPNSLYTTDGQGLWSNASALSSRATFNTIINSGYGVGIAYTDTKPDFTPNLSVNSLQAWNGSVSTRNTLYGTSNGNTFGNYSPSAGYPVMGDSVWFSVNFSAESQNIRVRQYVRIQGGGWTTRDIDLTGSSWFDVSFSPTTVEESRSSYVIEAKQDWIDSSGNVLKTGAVKTFYIPVKPKINRYQVTMYDITGAQVAQNGFTGQSGSLYVGQHVYPKYTYTSSNSWTSYNNFSDTINGTADLGLSGYSINSASALSAYSSLGLYTVPDVGGLPCRLTTAWASETSRTTETTQINIPVVKADVELSSISLIDQNGYYVTTVYQGQKVTPQYAYKNNTNVTVYVDGYDNSGAKIGTYAIPAYGTIYVNGAQFTVTSPTTLSVWGGVFLEGAGIHSTSWESNGSNNEKTLSLLITKPLSLELINPGYSYRQGTDVITSYKIKNDSGLVFPPNTSVSVSFTAYNGSTSVYSIVKNGVVIPANGENLVYFKWTVPTGGITQVRLVASITTNGYPMYDRTDYNGVIPSNTSTTPNTRFEKSAPSDFTKLSPSNNTVNTSAIWSEWIYENSSFVKKTYSIGILSASNSVVPDANCPSRQYTGGQWIMPSGYGFTSTLSLTLGTSGGYLSPPTGAYTNAQSANMLLPEFKFNSANGSYQAFATNGTNSFQLPLNGYAPGSARLHYVPLWFPDAPYVTQAYVQDFWTPVGMLTGFYNSNPINISKSAYDDWYVGR